MNINFNKLLKQLIPYFIFALLAYGINVGFYILLPKIYDTATQEKQPEIEYAKYYISRSFKEKKIIRIEKPKVVIKEEIKKEYKIISNISLKAIYQTSNNKGWIVISEISSSKTHILGVDEFFKKYRLKFIFTKYVVFEKDNKEYKLPLHKSENTKKLNYTITPKETIIKKQDSLYEIKKTTINSYINNFDKIWKEISIKERKVDGKIDGFKITSMARRTIFRDLGLRQNDIIKSVNNIKLKSYADAFKIYKKINKMRNISFIIIRDNKELELEYEIK
jgi:general secretion pathway protein C